MKRILFLCSIIISSTVIHGMESNHQARSNNENPDQQITRIEYLSQSPLRVKINGSGNLIPKSSSLQPRKIVIKGNKKLVDKATVNCSAPFDYFGDTGSDVCISTPDTYRPSVVGLTYLLNTQSLKYIELSGNASIGSTTTAEQPPLLTEQQVFTIHLSNQARAFFNFHASPKLQEFNVKLYDNAQATITEINVATVDAEIHKNSSCTLAGKATNQTISAYGNSTYDASHLPSEYARIEQWQKAKSSVTVSATKTETYYKNRLISTSLMPEKK